MKIIKDILAIEDPGGAGGGANPINQVFGSIPNPTKYGGSEGQGLFLFISNVFRLIGIIAGLVLVFQLIMAGFAYISASGDPKKAEAAWTKIWQSLLGIVIVSAAFVIASVVGRFTGIDILNPTIYGPQ